MTQQINPEKLKAAAEHLEWVCQQYPDNEDVQGLYRGLKAMIEDAKAGRVTEPVERVPFWYQHADGVYVPYNEPSLGGAYARFSDEIKGGVTEGKKQIKVYIAQLLKSKTGGQS